jgi:hypothetical protein
MGAWRLEGHLERVLHPTHWLPMSTDVVVERGHRPRRQVPAGGPPRASLRRACLPQGQGSRRRENGPRNSQKPFMGTTVGFERF